MTKNSGLDGLLRPRITIAEAEAEIVSEHYFTASDGAACGAFLRKQAIPPALGNMMFCVLTLANGEAVHSAVSIRSSNPDDRQAGLEWGKSLARLTAIEKIFPLLHFRAADRRMDTSDEVGEEIKLEGGVQFAPGVFSGEAPVEASERAARDGINVEPTQGADASPHDDGLVGGLTFPAAMMWLAQGHTVYRKGWNTGWRLAVNGEMVRLFNVTDSVRSDSDNIQLHGVDTVSCDWIVLRAETKPVEAAVEAQAPAPDKSTRELVNSQLSDVEKAFEELVRVSQIAIGLTPDETSEPIPPSTFEADLADTKVELLRICRAEIKGGLSIDAMCAAANVLKMLGAAN